MEGKYGGPFSLGFQSVQLQLKALLEGVGGEQALKLLDALSQLSAEEQEQVLRSCNRAIKTLCSRPERQASTGNAALKDFEEGLYQDILRGIKSEPHAPRLEVLCGGKEPLPRPSARSPLDLAKARKLKELRTKPLLN